MFDLIGDIHGHADKLKALLLKLGYSQTNESFSHAERKALFVGDYIDRGPQIIETLKIVRDMVENGSAIALMGNHEYNALCFHFPEKSGGHLRRHLIKNILQHYETLNQFKNKQTEYESFLDWFLTLPLFYETNNFKAVHASWSNGNIEYLRSQLKEDRLTESLLYRSNNKSDKLYNAIDETLKGKEIKIPDNLNFTDKDGFTRNEMRIKWWEDPANATYKSFSIVALDNLPAKSFPVSQIKNTEYYTETDKPVFFGHYWLNGKPDLYRDNVCCLDFSVAKGGYLTAYRYDGEEKLKKENLVFV
jgi:hypothetical protein